MTLLVLRSSSFSYTHKSNGLSDAPGYHSSFTGNLKLVTGLIFKFAGTASSTVLPLALAMSHSFQVDRKSYHNVNSRKGLGLLQWPWHQGTVT